MLNHLLIFFTSLIYLIAAFQPTTYTYKTIGDLSILADVYMPNTTASEKYPVVLAFHGGGFIVGTKLDAVTTQEIGEMLSRNWVVVSIDYRLVPAVFLEDIIQDVQDAYDWIRTELLNDIPINPDSIAVWGGSSGAGLALISGYTLTPRPKVVIALYPQCANYTGLTNYNPNTPLNASLVEAANAFRQPTIASYEVVPGSSNDARLSLLNDALSQQKLGWVFTTSDPNEPTEKIVEKLKTYSAVYNMDDSYPPTLLFHGLDDALVPIEQSLEMAEYLKQRNIPYKLNLVPDAGHLFDFGNLSSQVWEEYFLPGFDFVQKYLVDDLETETKNCK